LIHNSYSNNVLFTRPFNCESNLHVRKCILGHRVAVIISACKMHLRVTDRDSCAITFVSFKHKEIAHSGWRRNKREKFAPQNYFVVDSWSIQPLKKFDALFLTKRNIIFFFNKIERLNVVSFVNISNILLCITNIAIIF